MRKRHRELSKIAEQEGLKRLGTGLTRGTHITITVEAPDGRTKTFVFGNTPSDHRADMNNRAALRRWFRKDEGKAA